MDRPAEVPKPWALRRPLHKADLIPFRNRVTKCAYRLGGLLGDPQTVLNNQ